MNPCITELKKLQWVAEKTRIINPRKPLLLLKPGRTILFLASIQYTKTVPEKLLRHFVIPKYGNTNLMTGDQIDGADGIFKPRFDGAGNQIVGDPLNTSGFADGATSATIQPQTDPEIAGGMAAERVAMIAQGMQYPGLNNRQQIYGA